PWRFARFLTHPHDLRRSRLVALPQSCPIDAGRAMRAIESHRVAAWIHSPQVAFSDAAPEHVEQLERPARARQREVEHPRVACAIWVCCKRETGGKGSRILRR